MSRVKNIKGKPVNGRSNIIARLFKGGKQKPHPTKPGVMIAGDDLDHFRVEFEDNPSFNREWALECFRELYGDKPREFLNVQFRTDSAESALSSTNEQWVKSGKGVPICTVRCDGESINYRWNGDSASRETAPCEFPKCKCAFTYRLTFWLPEFTRRSGILGEFMLTGHSREDYERIQPNLDEIAGAEGEYLHRVGFTLYRQQVRVVQPDGKPSMKWIVHLNVMEAAAQRLALAAGEAAMVALPAPSEPPQVYIAGSQMDVVFQPFISIRNDAGYVEYRFMDKYGTIYSTVDSELVIRAVPEVAKLAVGKKHELDLQLSGLVSGNTIIELRSDPIPF